MTDEAVTVAKKRSSEEDGIVTLSTGVRARLHTVSQAIIQDAVALLQQPHPPMWYNPEKEREEPNPVDPDYLAALNRYEAKQYQITFNTFAMFGVELVDGIPEDDGWLKKLMLLDRVGTIDLSKFDLEHPIDLEYLYKRYIAMGNEDYILVSVKSGISQEEIRRAADSFQGEEVRGEN